MEIGLLDDWLAQLPPSALVYVAKRCRELLHRDFVVALPRELALLVLELLDNRTLCAARCVDRAWRVVIDAMPRWRRYADRFLVGAGPCQNPFQLCHQVSTNWRRSRFTQRVMARHSRSVFCVDFDLQKAVSASYDGTLVLWRFNPQRDDIVMQAVLTGHSKGVTCCALFRSLLFSGSSDGSVGVWTVADGRLIAQWRGHRAEVCSLILIEDKFLASSSCDGTVVLWDLGMEQGDSAAFINGRCHRVLTGHTDYVLSVAYQHPYIITGSLDQTIRLWSTNGDLKAAFPFSAPVRCVSANSDSIVVGDTIGNVFRVLVSQTPDHVIVSHSLILVGQHKDSVYCVRHELQHSQPTSSDSLPPVGLSTSRVISTSKDRTIVVWDYKTCQKLTEISAHANTVTFAAFDSVRILSTSFDKTVRLYNFS